MPRTKTTFDNITDSQITCLRDEAGMVGDEEMVVLCDKALLQRDEAARRECAKAISNAEAMEDERDEPCLCGACNGSGEGRYDGSTCYACGGSGELRDREAEYDRECERADYERDLAKDRDLDGTYDDGFIDDDLPF